MDRLSPFPAADNISPTSSRTLSLEPEPIHSKRQHEELNQNNPSDEAEYPMHEVSQEIPVAETETCNRVTTGKEQGNVDSASYSVTEERAGKETRGKDENEDENPEYSNPQDNDADNEPDHMNALDWDDIPIQIVCCLPATSYHHLSITQAQREMERAALLPIPDGDPLSSGKVEEVEGGTAAARGIYQSSEDADEYEPITYPDPTVPTLKRGVKRKAVRQSGREDGARAGKRKGWGWG